MSIPHLFRCPISLDLFTDPVTLSTGQTYDRRSIEKWLADGNQTCPVTMQRLTDKSLVPNHTLRHLIDKWLHAEDCQKKPMKSTNDADFSLITLKQKLQSPNATHAEKLESLKKIRVLSVESDVGQACLIQLGFFSLLLQLLFQSVAIDSGLAEVMLDCVLSLSSSAQLDSLNMLKEHSNMGSLVLLLEQGNTKIKTSLCHLIEIVASSTVTRELCLVVGQSRRVLQVLVSHLPYSEAAVRAMAAICSLESSRGYAIREGAVDGLVSYLSNSVRRNASRALATLEVLLRHEAGKKALVNNARAIAVLVKMVFRVSTDDEGSDSSEHALGSLLIVCRESEKVRLAAVNAGVLTQLLLLLQSRCSPKAQTKARVLLKMLRPFWTEQIRGL